MELIVSHVVGFIIGFVSAFLYENRSNFKKNRHNECSECEWNVMNGGTCMETKEVCGQFVNLNKL